MPEKCKRCNDKGYLHADGVVCPDCTPCVSGSCRQSVDDSPVTCATCGGCGYEEIVGGSWPCPECEKGKAIQASNQHKNPDHVPAAGQKVPPPEGYETWLDYAVAMFPVYKAVPPCVGYPDKVSAVYAAAQAELAELRATVARQQDQINGARMVLDD